MIFKGKVNIIGILYSRYVHDYLFEFEHVGISFKDALKNGVTDMLKRLIVVLLLTWPILSMAETEISLDTRGLTTSQKAELASKIAQMQEAKKATETLAQSIEPETVDKWVQTGTNFGKMLGGTAKELGVQVNEFVKTPVGIMATVLIVWNYMGVMLTHVFGGLVVITVGCLAVRGAANRLTPYYIEYSDKRTWYGARIKLCESNEGVNSSNIGWLTFCHFVVLIFGMITMFSY